MFDQKNQEDLSEERAQTWVEQLKDEGFFGTGSDAGPPNKPSDDAVSSNDGSDNNDHTEDDDEDHDDSKPEDKPDGPSDPGSDSETPTEARACIFFGTQGGNTEKAAEYLTAATGIGAIDIQDGDSLTEEFSDCDSILVGTPTYNTGAADHRSDTGWDDWMYEALPSIDISGKKVAVFCTGDQDTYSANYCDAAGELYDQFSNAGCSMLGFTSTAGYSNTKSKAERDGQFIGQMFDQDNQKSKSEERANTWVEQLRGEGFFDIGTPANSAADASVGIFFGTLGGNTEKAAEYLTAATGIGAIDIEAGDSFTEDFSNYDSIMVGTPTYNTGAADHRSDTRWDDWMYDVLPTIDMKGKNVAVFCTGDQDTYSANYCDAAGELYDQFSNAGCNMVGFTSTAGYSNTKSKAERNGQFIGQMFDEDNQKAKSEERANAWVEQLRDEGFFEVGGTPKPGDDKGGDRGDSNEESGGGLTGTALVVVIVVCILVPILLLGMYSHHNRIRFEKRAAQLLEEDRGTPYTQLLPEPI